METFYKVNGKLYSTKEEAEKAELALEEAKAKEAKLSEERKARAKEIDEIMDLITSHILQQNLIRLITYLIHSLDYSNWRSYPWIGHHYLMQLLL